jgi:predicted glutamine amidotransferase
MCRLFGFRSKVLSRTHRSLVVAENALAQQAAHHADGWGIGYYQGDDAYVLKSEAGACGDERFERVTERLRSQTFVVHVRRATVGAPDYFNSHPFRHGLWVFAHNGTIWDFERLRPRLLAAIRPDLADMIFGSTDSEHVFFYLLSALDRAGVAEGGRGEVDVLRAAEALRAAVGELYRWAQEEDLHPPLLNFILTNGEAFFAQRAGLELYLATQKVFCRDQATCREAIKVCLDVARPLEVLRQGRASRLPFRKVNHLLVATEPMGDEDIWEEVPEGMLLAMGPEFALYALPAAEGFSLCASPPAPAPSSRSRTRRAPLPAAPSR